METKTLLSLLAIAGVLIFASCKKEDDSQKFSPLTVEQNKAKIEENGTAMLNTVKEMEALATVDAAANMMSYMDQGDLFANNPNASKVSQFNEFLKPVMIAANMKKFNAKQVANELKATTDPNSLLELWNHVKGTYTWNSASKTWSWAAGDEISIKFPSKETGTTNNVEFRVYDFTYQVGPFTWMGDYTGELPTQIKSELKVDGTALLSYALNITYQNADNKPNSFTTSLELPPFKFALEVTNNNDANASISFEWTKTTTTLVAISLSASGNWTESNTSNQNLEPGDVIYTGNASFQLMNIKVVGNVDVKNLNKEMNNISISLTGKPLAEKECEIITKYASLYVCYADNKQIIANVIASPVSSNDLVWNSTTQSYEEKLVWDVGLSFKFADASTVDIDTYFGTGFSSLQTAIDDYLNELQTKY